MKYLAHSARDGCPEQSYEEHIRHVLTEAMNHARAAAKYAKSNGELLIRSVYNAALFHDLGKLDTENQKILRRIDYFGSMPIPHQDAGVARLKQLPGSRFSQLAICSHHCGLPDLPRERIRKNGTEFRIDFQSHPGILEKTNGELAELTKQHNLLVPDPPLSEESDSLSDCGTVFPRILLSCLTDADHTDTAAHYGKYPIDESMPELRAEERLKRLDAYVAGLQAGNSSKDERNLLRCEMYEACRDTVINESIVACDSPVGSGKTTAVMAHLLRRAAASGARRIFVILPFTNIIEQSVDTYRKALVLPGEDPEAVIAELHHRADFERENLRALSAVWRAPIIVTTAVAFFETLASNRPATLRRLHELPGSVIFVDEAHAAVPVKLLPVTWKWITELADEWGCYWVLASGSLVRFWEIEELGSKGRKVPQILSEDLRARLGVFENHRIEYRYRPNPLSVEELVDWVSSAPGPRLVIMNTVQSAAVIADCLMEICGQERVMHISTALKSDDRRRTVDHVRKRLTDCSDSDWTLVATSCVEAGVDFSFKTGFREIGSLLSLLQAAGRVNRNGKDSEAEIWSFIMANDPKLKSNPGVKDSALILKEYFEFDDKICPELSTCAVRQELQQNTAPQTGLSLLKEECEQHYPDVNEHYHVIDNDTVPVIVDEDLKREILYGGCNWKEIQKRAVTVSRCKVKDYRMEELAAGIYGWTLAYDPFLGIMRGVLDSDKPIFV